MDLFFREAAVAGGFHLMAGHFDKVRRYFGSQNMHLPWVKREVPLTIRERLRLAASRVAGKALLPLVRIATGVNALTLAIGSTLLVTLLMLALVLVVAITHDVLFDRITRGFRKIVRPAAKRTYHRAVSTIRSLSSSPEVIETPPSPRRNSSAGARRRR